MEQMFLLRGPQAQPVTTGGAGTFCTSVSLMEDWEGYAGQKEQHVRGLHSARERGLGGRGPGLRASVSQGSRAAFIWRLQGTWPSLALEERCRAEAGSGPWPRPPVPGLSAFRFPTRLLAKGVQATVRFFTSLEVCKNY